MLKIIAKKYWFLDYYPLSNALCDVLSGLYRPRRGDLPETKIHYITIKYSEQFK